MSVTRNRANLMIADKKVHRNSTSEIFFALIMKIIEHKIQTMYRIDLLNLFLKIRTVLGQLPQRKIAPQTVDPPPP